MMIPADGGKGKAREIHAMTRPYFKNIYREGCDNVTEGGSSDVP